MTLTLFIQQHTAGFQGLRPMVRAGPPLTGTRPCPLCGCCPGCFGFDSRADRCNRNCVAPAKPPLDRTGSPPFRLVFVKHLWWGRSVQRPEASIGGLGDIRTGLDSCVHLWPAV